MAMAVMAIAMAIATMAMAAMAMAIATFSRESISQTMEINAVDIDDLTELGNA